MSDGYDLANLLTNLASRMGNLEGQLSTFMSNWSQQDRLAHESRRITHERIEVLTRQVERVATDVENIQQDVAELKNEIDEEINPVMVEHQSRKDQRKGAKGVWAMIGAGAVALISALAYIADKAAQYLFPKP